MPIEKTTAYKVGDVFCNTLAEAQRESIVSLLIYGDAPTPNEIAETILEKKDEFIAILSMEDDAPKPRKPRKDKGTSRKSKQPELLPAA